MIPSWNIYEAVIAFLLVPMVISSCAHRPAGRETEISDVAPPRAVSPAEQYEVWFNNFATGCFTPDYRLLAKALSCVDEEACESKKPVPSIFVSKLSEE